MLNLVTYDGSYEGLKIKIKGISSILSPFTEIENRYSVFSIFLVLLRNGFIFGQFLKSIPVLKSSGPQLSHGHIYFLFALSFFACNEAFLHFFLHFFLIFLIWDKDFQSFITPLIFYQLQLPRTVLNAELNQLSENVIEFEIWLSFDKEIINFMEPGI